MQLELFLSNFISNACAGKLFYNDVSILVFVSTNFWIGT